MIENQFEVTLEDMKETSRPILFQTPAFRKTAFFTPLLLVVALIIIWAYNDGSSNMLPTAVCVLVLLVYLNTLRKLPNKMAHQLYANLCSVNDPPSMHNIVTEGGILVLGSEDMDAEEASDSAFPFSSLKHIFGTENFIIVLDVHNQAALFRRDAYLKGNDQLLLDTLQSRCPNAKFGKGL